MKRINKKKEIFGFFDLSAFKDGVADALLEGYKLIGTKIHTTIQKVTTLV